MTIARALVSFLALASVTLLADEPAASTAPKPPEVTFTTVEIEGYLNSFKGTYKNAKLPQEDAVSLLDSLKKAYRFLADKGDQLTKDEAKLKQRIVDTVAKGLQVKNRDHVSQECAKALGELGDPAGAKPVAEWLDKVVLDSRTPNPVFLEYGFQALAYIGVEDPAILDDLIISYGTGRHTDPGVATEVMKAVPNWRHLSGKNRKALFDRLNQYVGSVYNDRKNPERFDRIKDTALDMLTALAGEAQKFPDPPAVTKWWSENKKANWADYVGRPFQPKPADPKDKPAGKEGEGEKKEGGEGGKKDEGKS